MADEKSKNLFQKIAAWAKDVHEWVAANFSDPAIARSLREDLGLDPDAAAAPPAPLDPGKQAKIDEFVAKSAKDINQQALTQTVKQIADLVQTIVAFAESVSDNSTDGWDVATLMFQVWAHDSLRLRNPAAYAFMRLGGLLAQDEEMLGQLDPKLLKRALSGEADSSDAAALVARLTHG